MVSSLRQQFSEAARRCADAVACPVSIHPASMSDAAFLYRWRIDTGVDAASGKYTYDDHLKWMREFLSDPKRLDLVGEAQGRPVGVLSVRDDTDGSVAISIGMLDAESSKGYSTEMLKLVSDTMRGCPLSAEIWHKSYAFMAGIGPIGRRDAESDGQIIQWAKKPARK